MDDVFDELLTFWRKRKVAPAEATVTIDDIRSWEAANGVMLPDDLRTYVRKVNGIWRDEDLEFDHDVISFLPLKAMVPEGVWDKFHDGAGMFLFADCLIRSYWWCAHLTPKAAMQTPIYLRGKNLVQIADSLEEFLRLYMDESKRIHPQ